jgi:hypothetical protein
MIQVDVSIERMLLPLLLPPQFLRLLPPPCSCCIFASWRTWKTAYPIYLIIDLVKDLMTDKEE